MGFNIKTRGIYQHEAEEVKVVRIVSANNILVENFKGVRKSVKPTDLLPVLINKELPLPPELNQQQLDYYKNLAKAMHEYSESKDKKTVREIIQSNFKLTQPTFYRKLKAYETFGTASSMFRKSFSGGKGGSRLEPKVEEIITDVVENYFLTNQKVKVSHAIQQVFLQCHQEGLKKPGSVTVRNRIKNLDAKRTAQKRLGRKYSSEQYDLHRGAYPETRKPLEVVQIDHARVNVILVDDENRETTRRPWLTLAIDIHTRVVLGYFLTYNSPSTLSAGVCISNAILPKDKLIRDFKLDFEWPFCGYMDIIHADNAGEFTGSSLRDACHEHGIDIHWRPIGKPQYGSHIERLIGSFKSDMIVLSGTTGHDSSHRDNYSSEKMATMTISELEKWLLINIIGKYHNQIHKSLNTTPAKMWEKSIIGDEDTLGSGLPTFCEYPEKLKIDFLPTIRRSIQRRGIRINHITYRADILGNWLQKKNPTDKSSMFIFKQDPRNLSCLYFWDPVIKSYFEIPYADRRNPPVSIWEIQSAVNFLKKQRIKDFDESIIFRALEEMRQIEKDSLRKTKAVRREKVTFKSNVLKKRPDKEVGSIDFKNIKPF